MAGPSLPPTTRIGTALLVVSDADRARRFYGDLLGFTVSGDGDRLVASAGDQELLHLDVQPGARPQKPSESGLFHVAILLPDRPALGAVLQQLTTEGIGFRHGDHLVSESLYIADPDGNGLELYRDRPADTWEWSRDGQVTMGTFAVNLDELAGVAAPWTGMPEGTTIGHVHLQVDDLAVARGFLEDVLGLHVTLDGSAFGALFMAAGRYHHHVGANTWRSNGGQPTPADAAGLRSWDLVIDDPEVAAAIARRAEDRGWPVRADGPTTEIDGPWGVEVRVVTG